MNHPSDAELTENLRNGVPGAYDALFLKYYKMLCANAYMYIKDTDAARDIVQQFFIEFWEKKQYLVLDGDIKAYLYRAVKNRCLNQLRGHDRQEKIKAELTADYALSGQQMEAEIKEVLYTMLDDALHALPVQRRQALSLVYVQDKKYQDAASEMSISINSLKTHLKLGLKNLRDKIKFRND